MELGSNSWLCRLTSGRIWATDVTSLRLGFPTCKVETAIFFNLRELCEGELSSLSRYCYHRCFSRWKVIIIFLNRDLFILLFIWY